MMERKELYPLKFKTIYKDKVWGGNKMKTLLGKDYSPMPNCGETWEISAVPGNVSVVANGYLAGNDLCELIEVYMDELVGGMVFDKHGHDFPLLVKFIDAADDLSIQVHPGDELAGKRHQSPGKTEMWYVMESNPGAQLISGFKGTVDKESYLEHLENGKLRDIMNYEDTAAGDVFFIPAGRVHAIGKGILLAEIQQSSDVTYRIYDWDRPGQDGKPRELHTGLAIDAIDFEPQDSYRTDYEKAKNKSVGIVDCPYFTTNVIDLDQMMEKDYMNIDSFVIYICTEGQADVVYGQNKTEGLKKGECLLVPASLKQLTLRPKGRAKLLEVYVKE